MCEREDDLLAELIRSHLVGILPSLHNSEYIPNLGSSNAYLSCIPR